MSVAFAGGELSFTQNRLECPECVGCRLLRCTIRCPCMDSSSFASTLFVDDSIRLLTCIRSAYRAVWHVTLMGYSRACSQLLSRTLPHVDIHGFC